MVSVGEWNVVAAGVAASGRRAGGAYGEGIRASPFLRGVCRKRLDDAVDGLLLWRVGPADSDVLPAAHGDAALDQMDPILITQHPGCIAELADLAADGLQQKRVTGPAFTTRDT